jgi:hypothetical protein
MAGISVVRALDKASDTKGKFLNELSWTGGGRIGTEGKKRRSYGDQHELKRTRCNIRSEKNSPPLPWS